MDLERLTVEELIALGKLLELLGPAPTKEYALSRHRLAEAAAQVYARRIAWIDEQER